MRRLAALQVRRLQTTAERHKLRLVRRAKRGDCDIIVNDISRRVGIARSSLPSLCDPRPKSLYTIYVYLYKCKEEFHSNRGGIKSFLMHQVVVYIGAFRYHRLGFTLSLQSFSNSSGYVDNRDRLENSTYENSYTFAKLLCHAILHEYCMKSFTVMMVAMRCRCY